MTDGFSSVGAAVVDHSEHPVAAVALTYPSEVDRRAARGVGRAHGAAAQPPPRRARLINANKPPPDRTTACSSRLGQIVSIGSRGVT